MFRLMMRDGRGLERRWERDRRGLVQEYYDAVAGADPTYRYEYNHNDKLTRKFRIRRSVVPVEYVETETAYDAEDRELHVTEATGTPESRTMHYHSRDGMGNPLEVRDYNGYQTLYEYNAVYKVTKETDNKGKIIEYEYYPTTRLHRMIDKRIAAEPRTTTYEYDLLDREKRVEDPLLQSTQKTYDDVGNLLTVMDKRGIVTEHEYDSLYRRTRTARASQQVERREYNDVGRVIAEHDAYDLLVREFEYNDRHLLAKTIFRNDGAVTTNEFREYDGNGNLTELVDEEGKPTTYTHDGENRQLTLTFEGETTTRTYDEIGNLVSLTLPEGAPGGKFAGTMKVYGYDAHNRLTRVEEEELTAGSGGLVTSYTYDKNGNLQSIYDPLNNQVEYQYDSLDRRTKHIQRKNAGDLITRFEYDGVGNLTKVIDAKGQQFDYEYDLLDRRIGADYPNVPSPLLRLAEIDFAYDPNSNLERVDEKKYRPDDTEVTDTIVNTYDQFDRLDDSTRRGVLIDYEYDSNGNRLSVSMPNSTPSYSTSYTYTLRNWVKTATLGGQTTNFDYLPDGKLDTVSYPNGTQAAYTYHPTNRIQSITHNNPSGTLYSYSYAYDKNGNRETQAEFNDAVTENTSYEYDPMNRLIVYEITGHSDPFRREYTYEGYNRKTEKTFENGTLTEDKEYFYDQTNWLTRVATAAYAIDYTYDNNGNTLTKLDSRTPDEPINFQYSANDRLVQATKGLSGSEQILGQFDYNHEGNRIRHRLSDRGDVDYYYDDGAVIEERNAADDSLLAYYQYADRLIALAQPAGEQYYHHDALGSTIGLTDAAGADKKSYHLDPWGNIRWETGTSDNRRIFTGKEHDKNTGLVYFGARYYDPEIGRFITQDSYLGEQNQPPSLHRYLYAYSNPTVFIDLQGYQSWPSFDLFGTGSSLLDAAKVVTEKNLIGDTAAEISAEIAESSAEWGEGQVDAFADLSRELGHSIMSGQVFADIWKHEIVPWFTDPVGTAENVVTNVWYAPRNAWEFAKNATPQQIQQLNARIVVLGPMFILGGQFLAEQAGLAGLTMPSGSGMLESKTFKVKPPKLKAKPAVKPSVPAESTPSRGGLLGDILRETRGSTGKAKVVPTRGAPSGGAPEFRGIKIEAPVGTTRTTIRITEKGITRIETHLRNIGAIDDPPNAAMLQRLKRGKTTVQDINFYMHELKESSVIKSVPDLKAAHLKTLEWQGVPYGPGYESKIYHPSVIRQYSEYFNPAAWPK